MDISIIIPVYNVERYLKDCLDSIIQQSNEIMLQAIIVDDGSSDHSQTIAKHYTMLYPDIFEYHRKTNGGLSDARNYGVRFAKGTYLMFLDSDDYLREDACFALFTCLKKTQADVVLYDYISFDEHQQKAVTMLASDSGFISDRQYLLTQPTAWNKIVKTEAYKQHHITFPKGIWYEDRATTGAYINFAKRIYYLQQPLYYYRQRTNSIMNQQMYHPKMLDMKTAIAYMLEQLDIQRYHDEVEYICISNLIYQSGERLLPHHKKEEMAMFVHYMNDLFPNWEKNPYYLKRSKLYQSICKAIKQNHLGIARRLFHLKNKMV